MTHKNRKWIYDQNLAANCFFRSALNPPYLKVMIQITERCNMLCKHCFLSATNAGADLSYKDFESNMLDKLVQANVKKVTLTGGEPLLNPELVDMIVALDAAGIETCICTNATLAKESLLNEIAMLNVHFNVSLDGMSYKSHGTFRGINSQYQFDRTLQNIRLIGKYNMLNGVLTTPNKLSTIDEYVLLCDFAIEAGAKYLLLNPLSPLGRGKFASEYVITSNELNNIKQQLDSHISCNYNSTLFEVVYIRFPNIDSKMNSTCSAGMIPYIFVNGDIAICPYVVFAAENIDNDYIKSDFIIENIFNEIDIVTEIQRYKKEHEFCQYSRKENLGCTAMKIANNLPLECEDIL